VHTLKYTTGKYELIDSKIINVLDNEFQIHFNDVTFLFGFGDTKEFKNSKIVMDKEPTDGVYKIAIFNFNYRDLSGFLEPMPLGIVDGIQYFFNFTGWALPGKEYSVIIINIFKEVDNAR